MKPRRFDFFKGKKIGLNVSFLLKRRRFVLCRFS
jgi:hypothetical protein